MSVFSIVIAVLLDFALGDPPLWWHPVRVLGRVIEATEAFCRGLDSNARVQGSVFLLLNLFVFMFPIALILLIASFSRPLSILIEGVMIYFALGGTCLAKEVSGVADSLLRDGLPEARARVAMLVSRDVDGMSEEDISSSAIETLAENFSDSACATLFYAAIGGAFLAWIHRVANTLDAMVGYKTDEYIEFGFASARFDDAVNFLPSRVSSGIIALMSPAVGGSVNDTLGLIRSDGGALESPNSGYPIAAFAGALRVKLCGPTSYFGVLKEKPYIGTGKRPGVADITNSLNLYWLSYAFAAMAAVALRGVMWP